MLFAYVYISYIQIYIQYIYNDNWFVFPRFLGVEIDFWSFRSEIRQASTRMSFSDADSASRDRSYCEMMWSDEGTRLEVRA